MTTGTSVDHGAVLVAFEAELMGDTEAVTEGHERDPLDEIEAEFDSASADVTSTGDELVHTNWFMNIQVSSPPWRLVFEQTHDHSPWYKVERQVVDAYEQFASQRDLERLLDTSTCTDIEAVLAEMRSDFQAQQMSFEAGAEGSERNSLNALEAQWPDMASPPVTGDGHVPRNSDALA